MQTKPRVLRNTPPVTDAQGLEVLRHLRVAQAALSAAAGVQSTKRGNAAMRAAALDAVWKLRNSIDLLATKVADDIGREAWDREHEAGDRAVERLKKCEANQPFTPRRT